MTPPGGSQLLIILFLVLLLFGSRKLPELASSIGRSMRELRTGLREGTEDEPTADEDDPDRTT